MDRQVARRVRRGLLELWAVVLLSAVVGFLGPFGTYLGGGFPSRVASWGILLAGAYVLVRPTIVFWHWMAAITALPRGSLVFFGVLLSSLPMAALWRVVGSDEVRLLGGFAGLLPFSVLCALLILTVAWWAERVDAHLKRYYDGNNWSGDVVSAAPPPDKAPPSDAPVRSRLHRRLKPDFQGNILALESEDHYVRVHGATQSELVFVRLRDAIAEMDGRDGEQTHRSWWVARDSIAQVSGTGRTREIELANGLRVPIARDSVDRLERSGFLSPAR